MKSHFKRQCDSVMSRKIRPNEQTTGTKLILASEGLESLPSLSQHGLTQYLDVSSNSIASFAPEELPPFLKVFIAFDNRLTDISSVCKCKYLEVLRVQFNRLTSLSHCLSRLKLLKELRVDNNFLCDISPGEFEQCTQLAVVNISCNFLTSLDFTSQLRNLRVLLLAYNRITTVDALMECPSLEELDISFNNISFLSPGLTNHKHLQKLDVSCNSVQSLDEIGTLPKLCNLDISANVLKDLPPLIALFPRLEILDISTNELANPSALLDNLSQLPDLTELSVDVKMFPTSVAAEHGTAVIELLTSRLPNVNAINGTPVKEKFVEKQTGLVGDDTAHVKSDDELALEKLEFIHYPTGDLEEQLTRKFDQLQVTLQSMSSRSRQASDESTEDKTSNITKTAFTITNTDTGDVIS